MSGSAPGSQRVTINGRFLTQPLSGVQRYALELLLAFDRRVAAGANDGLEFELVVPARAAAVSPDLRSIRVRSVGRATGHAWEQLELPRSARGTVLFCPANTAPITALSGNQRTVVTVHSLSFLDARASYRVAFRWLYQALIPQVLRRADAVITVSNVERARILERYPFAASRLCAVDNGAAPYAFGRELLRPAPEPPERPFVLFVGTPMPSKNLALLTRTLDRVDPGRTFDLVVVGATADAYRGDPVATSGLARMRFEGQLENDVRLVELYRTATCLVHPSSYESSGLPPIEAMACGCPVVCSDLPVLRERCQDAARYVAVNDETALTDALAEVLCKTAVRADMAARGLARARAYSWDDCARATAEIIARVAGAPTGGSAGSERRVPPHA